MRGKPEYVGDSRGMLHTFLDLGAAQGAVPVQVALAHPHIASDGFDLPAVRPHFDTYVQGCGLADRLQFCKRSQGPVTHVRRHAALVF